jgi:GDP-L-fucose synthase
MFVTGHRGLVGSAIVNRMRDKTWAECLTAGRRELDLRDQAAVRDWFAEHRPAQVLHCAGTIGGIHANQTRPVEFFRDNMLIHLAVLDAAARSGVQKLLFLGSSCIYPRDCPQPIREEYLMSGPLETTNQAYAIAKISGLMSCQFYRRQYGCNFISAMPTNLYGPGDNFDLQSSHVVPALIRKFHDAKMRADTRVVVWGSGRPRREFMHVDDMADACLFLMEHYDQPETINIGTGQDVSIAELADLVRSIVYPEARIVFDGGKPDGTPRKLLDVSRIHDLGWHHTIDLEQGLRQTYRWFVDNLQEGCLRLNG